MPDTELDRQSVSGALYFAQKDTNRRTLKNGSVMSSPNYDSIMRQQASVQAEESSSVWRSPLTPTGNAMSASFVYTRRVGNDANVDVEGSIYTHDFAGVPTTVVASIKTVTPGQGRLYYARSTSSTLASFTTQAELPMPAGYVGSADPYIAGNPYTWGESPGAFYVVGVMHQNCLTCTPNAVSVWRSMDGALSWNRTDVTVNNDPVYHVDKPSIATSTNGSFLGRVYVAYVRVSTGNNNFNEIHLARGRIVNSVFAFDDDLILARFNPNDPPDVTYPDGGIVHAPQVVVDHRNGRIYVIYVNRGQNVLKMASVVDSVSPVGLLTHFKTEDVIAPRNLLTDGTIRLDGNVRSLTVPVARWNWSQARVCVVWHELEQPQQMTPRRTDVYFTSQSPGTGGGAWLTPQRISANTIQDQLQPALDTNSVGDLLVTFYSRHEDLAFNSDYRNFYTVMSALGGFPNGQIDREMKDEFGFDEWYAPPNQPTDPGFIGDYQEVWNWTFGGVSNFHSIWSAAPGVVRPTSNSDMMVTGIQ